MKDLTLDSFLGILNSIAYKTDIGSNYLSVLDSFEELGNTYGNAVDKIEECNIYLDKKETIKITKNVYKYGIIGTKSSTIILNIQSKPLVYRKGNYAKFVYYTCIVIVDKNGDGIDAKNFTINREFLCVVPIESVIKYSLYNFYGEMHGKMKELHEYVKLFLPENEVAQ